MLPNRPELQLKEGLPHANMLWGICFECAFFLCLNVKDVRSRCVLIPVCLSKPERSNTSAIYLPLGGFHCYSHFLLQLLSMQKPLL